MGSHLQNCTDFECNLHYKCPGHYCIPWRYVCEGKWDCPLGYDEFKITCGELRKCQRMFHCYGTGICLHLKDICDGYKDCPYGDDEVLCLLSTVYCPKVCICINFAIVCRNITAQNVKWARLPHVSVYITLNTITAAAIFLKVFT